LAVLVPAIEQYIEFSLRYSSISVLDMDPWQRLLWIIEGHNESSPLGTADIREINLIREQCCYSWHRHLWRKETGLWSEFCHMSSLKDGSLGSFISNVRFICNTYPETYF
jgi:hypothetical protein